MNTHYSTPTADLKNTIDSNGTEMVLVPLLSTRPWVRFLSILGFVSSGFMLLISIGIVAGASSAYGELSGPVAGFTSAIGVVYIFIGLLMFVPSLFLFKYASAITIADSTRNFEDLAAALGKQKSFWKFVGILALIQVILTVVGIVAAIAIPLMIAA